MKPEDFLEHYPGRLVPVGDEGWAYVPDPLPRSLLLPARIWRLYGEAENALGRLEGSFDRVVNPYLVGNPLLRREAILSSRIEGTIATPRQLALLEVEEEITEAPARADGDTREVRNYMRAMRHGLRRLESLPVCLRLIREVHEVLMQDVRGGSEQPGEFRTVQNFIGRRGDTLRTARFVPPPVPDMHAALHDLERFLNDAEGSASGDDALPLLVQLALVHYQFETIHPFRDGNGRVGRLLIPLLLSHHRKVRAPTLYLSAYFERNRDDYVGLMLRASQAGDFVAWIEFFVRGVLESADESCSRAAALLSLREEYQRAFQSARSSGLLQKLVDSLFEVPSTTIQRTGRILGVTEASASANIQKLVDAGILVEITGRKKNRRFLAPEILRVVHGPEGSDD